MAKTKADLQRMVDLLDMSNKALLEDNRRLRKSNKSLRRILKKLRHVTHPD